RRTTRRRATRRRAARRRLTHPAGRSGGAAEVRSRSPGGPRAGDRGAPRRAGRRRLPVVVAAVSAPRRGYGAEPGRPPVARGPGGGGGTGRRAQPVALRGDRRRRRQGTPSRRGDASGGRPGDRRDPGG